MPSVAGNNPDTFHWRHQRLLRDRTFKISHLTTHSLSGSQLVMGEITRTPYPTQGRYVVGWMRPIIRR